MSLSLARARALIGERWFGDGDPRYARRLRLGALVIALWLSTEVDLRYAHLPKGATVSLLGLALPATFWSSAAARWGAKIALWVGAALWLRGLARRWAAVTAVLGMWVLGSIYWENLPWFRHKFVAPLWVLVLLAAAEFRPGCAPRWLREGATLVLAAFYGGAGIAKLAGSGLAWADGVGLQLWMLRLGDPESVVRRWILADARLARACASAALTLELAAILLVFSPRLRRPVGALILALHAGIDAIFHIDFRPQMLLVALVLLPAATPRSSACMKPESAS